MHVDANWLEKCTILKCEKDGVPIEIIHLVRTQNEKLIFLPPDTHMYVCLSRGKKYKFYIS